MLRRTIYFWVSLLAAALTVQTAHSQFDEIGEPWGWYPTAPDSLTLTQGQSVSIDYSGHGFDPDSQTTVFDLVENSFGWPSDSVVAPAGLGLSGGGVLSGTPTSAPGTYTLHILGYDPTEDRTIGGGVLAVTITLNGPVNQSPSATNDSASAAYETAAVISVLSNDSDPEGGALNVEIRSNPSNGTAIANANGTVTYTPASGFSGSDSFTYRVSDPQGLNSANATVSVNVGAPPNSVPVAATDGATIVVGGWANLNVLANDTDSDGDSLQITRINSTNVTVGDTVTLPYTGGTVTLNASGDLLYNASNVPETTWRMEEVAPGELEPVEVPGPTSDNFTYQVSDGQGGVATGQVLISLTNTPPPEPQAPLAVNDNATMAYETADVISVLSNDNDPEGGALNVEIRSNPSNGTAIAHANGTVTYTPASGFSGTDSFTYRVSDPDGMVSSDATVSVTVGGPPNAVPVAAIDTGTVEVGASIALDVLANDSDGDNDPLEIVKINSTSVSSGSSVTLSSTGGVVTLTPSGMLVYDASYVPSTTWEFQETYPGSGELEPVEVAGPTSDSFSYEISDGKGGADTALVSLVLSQSPLPEPQAPSASNDSASTAYETSVTIAVLSNDSDPEGSALSVEVRSAPSNGTAIANANGTITYTPNAGFSGSDSFTYRVTDPQGLTSSDATVFVTVEVGSSGGGSGSVTVIEQFFDDDYLSGTSAYIAGGSSMRLSVSGEPFYSGSTSLRITAGSYSKVGPGNGTAISASNPVVRLAVYKASGSSGSLVVRHTSGWSTITLNASNNTYWRIDGADGQSGVSDLTADQWHVLEVDLVGLGVTDFKAIQVKGGGSDGNVYYFDDIANMSGFGSGTSTPSNTPPEANDGTLSLGDANSATLDISSLVSDADGDLLSLSIQAQPGGGTVSLSGFVITYTRSAGFTGSDTFQYSVSDGQDSSVATITIAGNPDTDPPLDADYLVQYEYDALGRLILANYSDSDADYVAWCYDEAGNRNRVSAGGGVWDRDCSASANQSPAASNDSATTAYETAAVISVLTNDSDPEGGALSVEIRSNPSNGTAVANANGTITYTPANGFSGSDSFTYRVSDPDGMFSNDATVSVTVEADTSGGGGTASLVEQFFDDDYLAGTSAHVGGGSSMGLSASGEPFYSGSASLKITAGSYSSVGAANGTAISSNNPVIRLAVYKVSGSSGNLVVRHTSGWSTITLNSTNNTYWRIDGADGQDGASSLSADQWSVVEIDVQALGVTDFKAIEIRGGGSGGNVYYFDDIANMSGFD